MTTEYCTSCCLHRSVTDFNTNRSRTNGLYEVCRSCQAAKRVGAKIVPKGQRCCRKCDRVLDVARFPVRGTGRAFTCYECRDKDIITYTTKICNVCLIIRPISAFTEGRVIISTCAICIKELHSIAASVVPLAPHRVGTINPEDIPDAVPISS